MSSYIQKLKKIGRPEDDEDLFALMDVLTDSSFVSSLCVVSAMTGAVPVVVNSANYKDPEDGQIKFGKSSSVHTVAGILYKLQELYGYWISEDDMLDDVREKFAFFVAEMARKKEVK